MDDVSGADLWVALAAVLFAVAVVLSLPRRSEDVRHRAYALTAVAAGLLSFMIGTLVGMN